MASRTTLTMSLTIFGEMPRAYADMAPDARRALIRRLLAHEYTDLLLRRWLDSTGWSEASVADGLFLQTLRTLCNEGIAKPAVELLLTGRKILITAAPVHERRFAAPAELARTDEIMLRFGRGCREGTF